MAAATTTTPLYGDIPDHPHRFINYVGRGFLLGASCGSACLFTRGALSTSPAGGRLRGGIHVVRSNAPRVAGVFGACSAMYCALERAMAVARRRDDPWNSIAACAASLGLFNMRSGGRAAALNALYGAAVATVFRGRRLGGW
ncbi:hypothetical protein HU200_036069 [Digitaria exilis]|uniref:Uncharacterized protein n=1 Tax=Digitaria exilis TaxID=1010633 RepID=A0A835BFQ3_9POAL|nr:hypothetical protein HU200_036069 [Digitaria exilis]